MAALLCARLEERGEACSTPRPAANRRAHTSSPCLMVREGAAKGRDSLQRVPHAAAFQPAAPLVARPRSLLPPHTHARRVRLGRPRQRRRPGPTSRTTRRRTCRDIAETAPCRAPCRPRASPRSSPPRACTSCRTVELPVYATARAETQRSTPFSSRRRCARDAARGGGPRRDLYLLSRCALRPRRARGWRSWGSLGGGGRRQSTPVSCKFAVRQGRFSQIDLCISPSPSPRDLQCCLRSKVRQVRHRYTLYSRGRLVVRVYDQLRVVTKKDRHGSAGAAAGGGATRNAPREDHAGRGGEGDPGRRHKERTQGLPRL